MALLPTVEATEWEGGSSPGSTWLRGRHSWAASSGALVALRMWGVCQGTSIVPLLRGVQRSGAPVSHQLGCLAWGPSSSRGPPPPSFSHSQCGWLCHATVQSVLVPPHLLLLGVDIIWGVAAQLEKLDGILQH